MELHTDNNDEQAEQTQQVMPYKCNNCGVEASEEESAGWYVEDCCLCPACRECSDADDEIAQAQKTADAMMRKLASFEDMINYHTGIGALLTDGLYNEAMLLSDDEHQSGNDLQAKIMSMNVIDAVLFASKQVTQIAHIFSNYQSFFPVIFDLLHVPVRTPAIDGFDAPFVVVNHIDKRLAVYYMQMYILRSDLDHKITEKCIVHTHGTRNIVDDEDGSQKYVYVPSSAFAGPGDGVVCASIIPITIMATTPEEAANWVIKVPGQETEQAPELESDN